MLIKVDENLHEDVAVMLCQHGHDAMTVYDQQMQGHADEIWRQSAVAKGE